MHFIDSAIFPALLVVLVTSGTDATHSHHGGGYGNDHHHAPAHYNFKYGVHDDYKGVNFGHAETRDGHDTKGEYFVDLPDGRKQTVSYTADKWGYHPKVHYDGKAKFGPSKGHGYGHGGHGGHGKGHGGYH